MRDWPMQGKVDFQERSLFSKKEKRRKKKERKKKKMMMNNCQKGGKNKRKKDFLHIRDLEELEHSNKTV